MPDDIDDILSDVDDDFASYSVKPKKKEKSGEPPAQPKTEPSDINNNETVQKDINASLDEVVLGEAGDFELKYNELKQEDTINADLFEIENNKSRLDDEIPEEKTSNSFETTTEEANKDEASNKIISEKGISNTSNQTPLEDSSSPAKSLSDSFFTLKGTKKWNTRDPYIITLADNKLKNEQQMLASTVYFNEEPEEQSEIKNKIKEGIKLLLRKSMHDFESAYSDFIFKMISFQNNEMNLYFDLKDYETLFMYHLGPSNISKILISTYKEKKIGICYNHTMDKKIIKFIPEEFIKYTVLHWYEENINNADLAFDSVQQFDGIKTLVSEKYQKLVNAFNKKHYEINLKIGPQKSISREELIQAKGIKWFGIANIMVFKRFLTSTIFN